VQLLMKIPFLGFLSATGADPLRWDEKSVIYHEYEHAFAPYLL
jgi:hypothetical protein